jgi:hypothetical protein
MDGNVKFSWSYWLLYGSAISFFLNSLFLFCNRETRKLHVRLVNK